MKIKNKKNYLLGILLSTLMIVGIINVTNGETRIVTNPDSSKLHTPSLFSLFLGTNDSNSAKMGVNAGGNTLNIRDGLIIGKNHIVVGSPKLSVVGGGEFNTMNGSNAGIGGGYKNQVLYNNGVIGGGKENRIEGVNGIIAGGTNNHSTYLGIILGGQDNEAVGGYPNMSNDYAIILGGKGNKANLSSLVLGSNAYGNPDSFAWNGHATTKSARIDATGGMLIGTYNPITGVSLVVSGSIKLSNPSGTPNSTGGVFLNTKGCIQFYDGNVYNTLGKASENNDYCGIDTGCQFGIATLHNGDIVTAYSVSYTGNCQNASGQVTCTNGNLVDNKGQTGVYVYPYCYNLSDDPIITVTKGYQTCSEGLPDNAEWVNQYFTQELDTNTNTYNSQPEAQFDPSGAKECSYDCKSGYEHENGSCVAKCIGGDEPDSNDPNIQKNTSTSQPQEWEYVNPGSELAACQWTCIGGAIREGNKCVPMDADACSTNITFPNGLCAEGEASDVSIEIQDINNFTKSAYGTWSCGNLSCGGRIPTATFNRELSGQDLKISINKYINRSNSRTYDSVNFSGVTVWFRHNEREKHPVIYNSISDIYTSRGDGGQYEFAANPIRYGNKCRRRNGSEYNNCTTDSTTPLFWAKDGYIMVEGNESNNQNEGDAYLKPGNTINSRMAEIASGNLDNILYFKIAESIPTSAKKDENIISTNDSPKEVWMWYNNGTIYYYSEAQKIYLNNNSSEMFKDCENLKTIDTIRRNTSKVKNMSYMFYGCSKLTNIDVNASNGWDTKEVTNMNSMFAGCSSLETLELSNWNTAKVNDMGLMFESCSKLIELDLSNWDTQNVYGGIQQRNGMYGMFRNCSKLQKIKFGNKWNTKKIVEMSHMFDGCSSLTGLNISNWNTQNVKYMDYMFYGCSSLTGLNISNWNTQNVLSMNKMFAHCKQLKNLQVPKNVSNVTDMTDMFFDCEDLQTLDLSNWNTSSVGKMAQMFGNCTKLETIYVGENFTTNGVPNHQNGNVAASQSYNMFYGSTEIKGGQGTTYSGSHIDKEYARIDCGPSKPGYFSRKDGDYSSCVEGTFHNTTVDDSIKFDILGKAIIETDPQLGCIKNGQFLPAWGWYNNSFTNHCVHTNTNTAAFIIFSANQDGGPEDYHEWYDKYTVTKENMPGYDSSFITDVGLGYTYNAGSYNNERIYYIYATATENQRAINYYNSLKDDNGIIDGNMSRSPISGVTPYGAYIRITAQDGTYKQYALKMNDDYHLYGTLNGHNSYYTLDPYPSHVINSIDYYGPVNRTIETRNNTFGSINFGGAGSWKFYAILHTNSALPDIAFPYDLYQTYHNKTSGGTPMSYLKLTQTNNNSY